MVVKTRNNRLNLLLFKNTTLKTDFEEACRTRNLFISSDEVFDKIKYSDHQYSGPQFDSEVVFGWKHGYIPLRHDKCLHKLIPQKLEIFGDLAIETSKLGATAKTPSSTEISGQLDALVKENFHLTSCVYSEANKVSQLTKECSEMKKRLNIQKEYYESLLGYQGYQLIQSNTNRRIVEIERDHYKSMYYMTQQDMETSDPLEDSPSLEDLFGDYE